MKSSNKLKNLNKQIDQQLAGKVVSEEKINTIGKALFEAAQIMRKIDID